MNEITNAFREAKKQVEESHKFLLLAHRRPDGDTLGAGCAINLALRAMGKETTMACVDEPGERFHFLPEIHSFVQEFDFKKYDTIIVSDAGSAYMTEFDKKYPDIFDGDIPVINIDHHASNDNYGTINIVDPNAASATVIIYKWFQVLGVTITPGIATSLLAGMYNDTGSFMHSNTTQEVLEIAADLVSKGGKTNIITKSMFKTFTMPALKLWGKVLENIKSTEKDGTIAVLTQKDFDDCGATREDASGVIDLLNAIPRAQFSLLLTEDGEGNIKGSFRTQREDVDLSKLAGIFGGGGHKKAAGFTLPGKIVKEEKWHIIPEKPIKNTDAREFSSSISIEKGIKG